MIVLLTMAGCGSSPRPAPRAETVSTLRITQHHGGTHYRTLVRDGRWYQTFGTELLVLDTRSARVLHRVELGRIGESGPAIDMAFWDDELVVVIEDEAVLELTLPADRAPRLAARHSASSLGILPRSVAVVEGDVYVSGEGGVAKLGHGRIFEAEGELSRVAPSEYGPVVCSGRRIYRLEDGQYVGSASKLVDIGQPSSRAVASGWKEDTIVFARQSEQGALVGLMGRDLRELDAQQLTVAVPGTVRSLRLLDDMLCVVTDTEVLGYVAHDGRLVRLMQISLYGANDVARLDDDTLAIAGSFGRTMYRERMTQRGKTGDFLMAHREPSKLTKARTDGRYVLAEGTEGAWLYHIGSRVDLTDQRVDDPSPAPPPSTRAATLNAEASLSADGMTLTLTTPAGSAPYREPRGRMHTVIASDGDFWVGHDYGISVLRDTIEMRSAGDGGPRVRRVGGFRLDGPVRYLFPGRVGGGATYVAEAGGFGIARFIQEPKP